MNKMISAVSTAVVLALTSLASIAPASAAQWHSQYQQQDRYIEDFCDRNPNASQCRDWRLNHSQWNDGQYQNFYRIHRDNSVFSSNFLVGLFGFTFGPTTKNLSGSMSAHVRACEQKYRSFDARTDRFLGYDGLHHLCRL